MPHVRLRKFNTRDVYPGAPIENDMCMVVRAGRTIFIRGQTGLDLNNKFVGKGDPGAQAEQAIRNVKQLLEEAGSKLEHICKLTTYITPTARTARRSTTSSGATSRGSIPAVPASSCAASQCPR